MAHFIDKDALVAEIERRIKFFTEESGNSNSDIVIALFGLKSFIDTLDELQECDFDTAIERYIGQHKGELRGYFDIRRIARHFFELGRFISYVSIKKK